MVIDHEIPEIYDVSDEDVVSHAFLFEVSHGMGQYCPQNVNLYTLNYIQNIKINYID